MRIRRKLIAVLLIITIISSFMPNLISYAAKPSFTMTVDGTAVEGNMIPLVSGKTSVNVEVVMG